MANVVERHTGLSERQLVDRCKDAVAIEPFACACARLRRDKLTLTFGAHLRLLQKGAFTHASITTVDLAGAMHLKQIDAMAFAKCNKLVTVKLNDSLETIGRNAFYECANLTTIDLNQCAGIVIEEAAFYGCVRLNMEISAPAKIGPLAFRRTLAKAARSLRAHVEITAFDVNTQTNCTFWRKGTTNHKRPGYPVTQLPGANNMYTAAGRVFCVPAKDDPNQKKTYEYLHAPREFDLDAQTTPAGLKTLHVESMVTCTGGKHLTMKTLSLGKNVYMVQAWFKECAALERIRTAGPVRLNDYAFQSCTFLTHINIDLIGKIRENTFANCVNLTTVTLVALKPDKTTDNLLEIHETAFPDELSECELTIVGHMVLDVVLKPATVWKTVSVNSAKSFKSDNVVDAIKININVNGSVRIGSTPPTDKWPARLEVLEICADTFVLPNRFESNGIKTINIRKPLRPGKWRRGHHRVLPARYKDLVKQFEGVDQVPWASSKKRSAYVLAKNTRRDVHAAHRRAYDEMANIHPTTQQVVRIHKDVWKHGPPLHVTTMATAGINVRFSDPPYWWHLHLVAPHSARHTQWIASLPSKVNWLTITLDRRACSAWRRHPSPANTKSVVNVLRINPAIPAIAQRVLESVPNVLVAVVPRRAHARVERTTIVEWTKLSARSLRLTVRPGFVRTATVKIIDHDAPGVGRWTRTMPEIEVDTNTIEAGQNAGHVSKTTVFASAPHQCAYCDNCATSYRSRPLASSIPQLAYNCEQVMHGETTPDPVVRTKYSRTVARDEFKLILAQFANQTIRVCNTPGCKRRAFHCTLAGYTCIVHTAKIDTDKADHNFPFLCDDHKSNNKPNDIVHELGAPEAAFAGCYVAYTMGIRKKTKTTPLNAETFAHPSEIVKGAVKSQIELDGTGTVGAPRTDLDAIQAAGFVAADTYAWAATFAGAIAADLATDASITALSSTDDNKHHGIVLAVMRLALTYDDVLTCTSAAIAAYVINPSDANAANRAITSIAWDKSPTSVTTAAALEIDTAHVTAFKLLVNAVTTPREDTNQRKFFKVDPLDVIEIKTAAAGAYAALGAFALFTPALNVYERTVLGDTCLRGLAVRHRFYAKVTEDDARFAELARRKEASQTELTELKGVAGSETLATPHGTVENVMRIVKTQYSHLTQRDVHNALCDVGKIGTRDVWQYIVAVARCNDIIPATDIAGTDVFVRVPPTENYIEKCPPWKAPGGSTTPHVVAAIAAATARDTACKTTNAHTWTVSGVPFDGVTDSHSVFRIVGSTSGKDTAHAHSLLQTKAPPNTDVLSRLEEAADRRGGAYVPAPLQRPFWHPSVRIAFDTPTAHPPPRTFLPNMDTVLANPAIFREARAEGGHMLSILPQMNVDALAREIQHATVAKRIAKAGPWCMTVGLHTQPLEPKRVATASPRTSVAATDIAFYDWAFAVTKVTKDAMRCIAPANMAMFFKTHRSLDEIAHIAMFAKLAQLAHPTKAQMASNLIAHIKGNLAAGQSIETLAFYTMVTFQNEKIPTAEPTAHFKTERDNVIDALVASEAGSDECRDRITLAVDCYAVYNPVATTLLFDNTTMNPECTWPTNIGAAQIDASVRTGTVALEYPTETKDLLVEIRTIMAFIPSLRKFAMGTIQPVTFLQTLERVVNADPLTPFGPESGDRTTWTNAMTESAQYVTVCYESGAKTVTKRYAATNITAAMAAHADQPEHRLYDTTILNETPWKSFAELARFMLSSGVANVEWYTSDVGMELRGCIGELFRRMLDTPNG